MLTRANATRPVAKNDSEEKVAALLRTLSPEQMRQALARALTGEGVV